jgi:hypothetical protein
MGLHVKYARRERERENYIDFVDLNFEFQDNNKIIGFC